MSKEEILHLFDFGEDDMHDGSLDNIVLPVQDNPGFSQRKTIPAPPHPCDKIMESLLSRHQPRWIANFHEHETLLQENEEERLSKEEQELAWANFQQSLEWEEVQRVSLEDPERKPTTTFQSAPLETSVHPQQSKASSKGQQQSAAHQRKCSNLDHLLTLRSKGIKSGLSTTCEKCSQEISWENLNRDGKRIKNY